jgi:hypothetical protein
MTPNDQDSNPSRSDRSNQSLVSDRLVENEPGFSRRAFLGMTGASLLMARSLSASAAAEARNGIPYRPLGRTGKRFHSLDSVGIIWPDRAIHPRAFELSGPDSMKESISSITAGTTTAERAKFEWAKLSVTAIVRTPF